MAGFDNVRALSDAIFAGKRVSTSWRKVPAVATAAGYWMDLSMSPGNPKPNYYASSPLVAATLAQSTDGGIYHGGAVSPATKRLCRLMGMSGSNPLTLQLCDYLLYYPFIDEGAIGEEQTMVNGVSLPRWTSGAGVQMMAVCVAGHTGAVVCTFNVNYTNQAGVAGRTSQTVTIERAQFVNGTLVTSAPATAGCLGPFIPLQQGDTGVRSVQSVTIQSGGDVGLFTLVLVKPITEIMFLHASGPTEVCHLTDKPTLPDIADDAYLNFLALPAGSLSGAQLIGTANFVWS